MKNFIIKISFLIGISTNIFAQIPNAGFENWTNVSTYYTPDSWECLNNQTASTSTFTCERGTPGFSGNYYLKLTSRTVAAMGVVSGIAISGAFQPLTGFAFNQRPANLTGKWQHMIFGSSQGYVDVRLTRWDATMQMRMTVASVHYTLTGMAMSWSSFSIPLTYTEGNNPDSCIITFSASGSMPTNNDYLYLDDLAFSGSVVGISDVNQNSNFSIYPNPTTNFLTINYDNSKATKLSLAIYNELGVLVKSEVLKQKNQQLFVGDLSNGIYTITIISGERIEKKKFLIQR